MNSYRLTSIIACRILALYLFLMYFGSIGALVSFDRTFNSFSSFAYELAIIGTAYAPPVLLWVFAPWIAKRMVPDIEDNSEEGRESKVSAIQVTAFSVLGIFFVFTSIPRAAITVLTYYRLEEVTLPPHLSVSSVVVFPLVRCVMATVFGLWLFFGAHWFVDLSRRFQGTNEENA